MQVNGELTQVISKPRHDKADNNNDDDNSKDDDDDEGEEEDCAVIQHIKTGVV